jgi:DNA-binding helix-hairpin-helix protein with protein kinase domain
VYALVDCDSDAAKIYLRAGAAPAEKLRWMASRPAAMIENLCKVAAWPRRLLRRTPGGPVAGFVMPRFRGYEPIHHLHNPAQRRKFFPRDDWAFLALAARNCAAAFDELHNAAGCIIGDVNERNVFVSHKAQVIILDCDSFQITVNGQPRVCEVGVQHYTPPELLAQLGHRSFRDLVRTLNHDRFGLAVLLFQLLFVGRHPYAGTYLGSGDLSFEQAIQQFRYAYGRDAVRLQVKRPPHTPPPEEVVSEEVTRLFERAFSRGSEIPDTRPTAAEWVGALDRLFVRFGKKLQECAADPGHRWAAPHQRCPWCAITTGGGPNYFFGVALLASTFELDAVRLAQLDARLRRAVYTGFTYERRDFLPRNPVEGTPVPELPEHRTISQVLGAVTVLGMVCVLAAVFTKAIAYFGVLVALVFGIWWLIHRATSPYQREKRARRDALSRAEWELQACESGWRATVNEYAKQYTQQCARVETLLDRARHLEELYRQERKHLEANSEQLARDEYLRIQFLIDAEVPGIGPERKKVLASYGVETAYDIEQDRILLIKGFGRRYTGNLLAWKASVLSSFRFDPRQGIPEAELQLLVQKFKQEEAGLLTDLEKGVGEPERLTEQTRQGLSGLEPRLRELALRWAQAKADVEVLG